MKLWYWRRGIYNWEGGVFVFSVSRELAAEHIKYHEKLDSLSLEDVVECEAVEGWLYDDVLR